MTSSGKMSEDASNQTLPSGIARGLGDKSYEKRKSASLEITSLVRTLQDRGDNDKIAGLITHIAREFVRHKNYNHRKGGLIGLAAVAIGLVSDIDKFLHTLVPPVLECFDDQESRVCYYACESMYNIVKVARGGILEYFNPLFDGVCCLFDHTDPDVKVSVPQTSPRTRTGVPAAAPSLPA